MCIIFWPGNFLRRERLRRPDPDHLPEASDEEFNRKRLHSWKDDFRDKRQCEQTALYFHSFIYLLRMTGTVAFKSRLKLNCSRPVTITTPDFTASSQHRALDSLAIYTIKFLCFSRCVSELLSHSPKIIEFYLSIQILFEFY